MFIEIGLENWAIKHVDMEKDYAFDFGGALAALLAGRKVTREGWNGKGMFLYYVPAGAYAALTDIAKNYWKNEYVPYRAYIAIKTVNEDVSPWVASNSDLLANDWVVLI